MTEKVKMDDSQSDFVTPALNSNLLNRGMLESHAGSELTMMEAIPYFIHDEVHQSVLQGTHPFYFQDRAQVKRTILQLTLGMQEKENWTRNPSEVKQIERNAARALYKLISFVHNNRKPRLGAQQPLKANYVPKLLAIGRYHAFVKHLSKKRQEKLKYYLSFVKDHFKQRDLYKKIIPLDQQKHFYF